MNLKKYLILLLFVSTFFTLSFQKMSFSSDTELKLDKEYYPSLLKDIKSAKKSIFCVIYLIKVNFKSENDPVRILLDALINAKKRGVEVTVIADHNTTFWEKNERLESKSDAALAYLKKNGINVNLDPIDIITHNKVVVIDEKIVHLGSSNWTYSALSFNHEANLRCVNVKMAQELRKKLKQIKVKAYDATNK